MSEHPVPTEAPPAPPRHRLGPGRWIRSGLARAFAGTLLAGLLSRLLVLAMTIILARQLSPDGYGIFIFATGTAALAAQCAGLGWPALMSRLIPTFRIQENWPALRALLRWGDGVVFLGSLAAFILIGIAMMLLGVACWTQHLHFAPFLVSGLVIHAYGLAVLVLGITAFRK